MSHQEDINFLHTFIHYRSVCFCLTILYKENQLPEDTQPNKTIYSVILETCPSLLHQLLPCPLRADSSGHDSSHYLPISPSADRYLSYCTYLCFYLSFSDSHTCSLTTQTQSLSGARWCFYTTGVISLRCAILTAYCAMYQRQKISPWSLIFVKVGVRCNVAIHPGLEWGGWQVEIKQLKQGEGLWSTDKKKRGGKKRKVWLKQGKLIPQSSFTV